MEKAIKYIQSKEYPFTNDGLILTPIYAPHNSKNNSKETFIHEIPETLKIKPHHEFTFDVRVDLDKQNIYAHMSTSMYKGTKDFLSVKETVLWNTIPMEHHMKIVELKPEKIDDTWRVSFSRVRDDRVFPNNVKISIKYGQV